MSLNSANQRNAERFAMQIPVEFLFDDGVKLNVVTRDVSASGVFVNVMRGLDVQDQLRFMITFPREITTSCRILALCDGTVVRREPGFDYDGLAIKIERYEFLGSRP